MNLILALILAIIIMLCMFLIQNKLVALTVVLIIIIMLILARPGDFTLNHSYIVTYTENDNDNDGSASLASGEGEQESAGAEQESAGAEQESAGAEQENILPGVPTPSFDLSGSSANTFATYLGLSENNMEHIGEQLEGIDWGNLLKKSLDRLKTYSEGTGVNGTNNSKLNANAAGVESGSPAGAGVESGSPSGN